MPLHVNVNKSSAQLGATAASFSPWGAVAGGVTSALGSLYSASQSRKEAQRNRDFQERMSSTAHQREVKDLRKAGLNPILSATKLAGSSTPGGSMATMPDLGAHTGKSLLALAQLRLVKAQARKINSDAANSEYQQPENRAIADLFDSPAGTGAKLLQLGRAITRGK